MNIIRSNSTERGSAGSTATTSVIRKIDPALPRSVLLTLLILFCAGQALSQETSIAGRVVASSGNFPIVNARVIARAAGGPTSMRMATTDEDGKFKLTDLSPGNYVVRVGAVGYIPEPSFTASSFYRPGENITIRMIKGGVITGRVLNKNGEPMALARVRSVRVKDEEGNP